jgi:UPF0755 protein
MKRAFKTLFGAFLGLVLVVLAAAGYWGYTEWMRLSEPIQSPLRAFVVAKGTSFDRFTQQLVRDGLAQQPLAIKLYGRVNPAIRRLKAGEYAVEPSDSTLTILKRVSRGEVIQRSVTIPEGWNFREIAPILAAAEVADADEFLRLATNAVLITELTGTQAPSLEGYLFPDTYHFSKGYGAEGVIRKMVARFKQNVPSNYAEKASAVGLTPYQAITLASIIEKETGATSERRLISAVFHNRLKKRMRLQSDPTVIYGMVNYNGNIRKVDLQTTTPYNTYRVGGIPPGPIANAGLDAILAAVEPAPVPYLYFVSKNAGTHYFSSTLVEHNRAVTLYQKSLLNKR